MMTDKPGIVSERKSVALSMSPLYSTSLPAAREALISSGRCLEDSLSNLPFLSPSEILQAQDGTVC